MAELVAHTMRPAVLGLECQACGEVVEILVPVMIHFDPDRDGLNLGLEVDSDAVDVQPFWDHHLERHGPLLDL